MSYELKNGELIEDEQLSRTFEQLFELNVYNSSVYTWDDIGTATLMADLYGDGLRYCPQNGKWYIWDDCWRKQGDSGVIEDKLQTLLNLLWIYSGELEGDEKKLAAYRKYLSSIRKHRAMQGIIETLKTARELRMSLSDMDTNPYILNTPRGAYDLRNDTRISDIRQYNVTKKTACGLPDFTTKVCERWYRFIDEIMGGDKEKAAFLQRALGYSILGVNREECMFIAYGARTRNGKGTLFSAISGALGADYVGACAPDLICEGKNGKSTDFNAAQPALAKLVGVRLCNMSESAKDVRLDAASMKTITGRDTLTTRDLYESSFDFVPQFTLWLNTNHLPAVTDDTVFASDRIWVIEFNQHFDGDAQDKDLKEVFANKENQPTILKWLVDGCREYLRQGLNIPACVREATANYKRMHDRIGCFIAECCKRREDVEGGEELRITRGALYAAYRSWCVKAENSYKPMGSTSFYNEILARGYPPMRKSDGWYIDGLELIM